MAGNKKPRRKPAPKGIGTEKRVLQLAARGIVERHKRGLAMNAREVRAYNLPLGHPMNRTVMEQTFGPLERFLDENERTGSMMFDDEGVALLWVPSENCWTPVVTGALEMCHYWDCVARALAWGDQPQGLRAFALKLGRGEKLDKSDLDDARLTLKWMRERIATISRAKWAAVRGEIDAIEQRESEKNHA
jgi:hypothetical protein